jgi:hypothetical protein
MAPDRSNDTEISDDSPDLCPDDKLSLPKTKTGRQFLLVSSRGGKEKNYAYVMRLYRQSMTPFKQKMRVT